jgi:hypothetical protein
MSTRAWARGLSGLVGLVFLGLAPTQRLMAQVCRPPASSNEAKTFAIFSVPLAFGPVDAPTLHPKFQFGIEAAYLPTISPATATPTICQPGKGPESIDLLFAVPRPRIGLPLPLGLALEASWIPPVPVAGVKADLFGVSLARGFQLWNLTGSVRAHGTFGSIRAPITCNRAALSDQSSECFNGTLSDDRFSPNIFGADLSLGKTMFDGRLRPYIGGGYSRLDPRFQVNFTNQFGNVDRTRVVVDLDRLALFGGATWQMAGRFAATTEVYSAPADAVTVRLALRATLGH